MIPYLLACLAILLTPGPTNTLLAAAGAVLGWRRALWLPVAEALGYALAISGFIAAGGLLAGVPMALPALKVAAALWLVATAVKLWSQPVVPDEGGPGEAFGRVLVTTLLNPKAMLVGTIMVPDMMPGAPMAALTGFVALSLLAGTGWVLLGAALPAGFRRYSYKGAAMIVTGFALAAMVSAWQG